MDPGAPKSVLRVKMDAQAFFDLDPFCGTSRSRSSGCIHLVMMISCAGELTFVSPVLGSTSPPKSVAEVRLLKGVCLGSNRKYLCDPRETDGGLLIEDEKAVQWLLQIESNSRLLSLTMLGVGWFAFGAVLHVHILDLRSMDSFTAKGRMLTSTSFRRRGRRRRILSPRSEVLVVL